MNHWKANLVLYTQTFDIRVLGVFFWCQFITPNKKKILIYLIAKDRKVEPDIKRWDTPSG